MTCQSNVSTTKNKLKQFENFIHVNNFFQIFQTRKLFWVENNDFPKVQTVWCIKVRQNVILEWIVVNYKKSVNIRKKISDIIKPIDPPLHLESKNVNYKNSCCRVQSQLKTVYRKK